MMSYKWRKGKRASFSFMAPSSLSSLLQFHSHSLFSSHNPNPKFTHSHTLTLPSRTSPRTLTFRSASNPNPSPTPGTDESSPSPSPLSPPPPVRKSFAVATGDLFLGLASRLINKPSRGPNGEELASVAMFENYGSVVRSKKERIGAVIEDEIEPDVVWEQSVMDVEAEKQRRVVTSPGFSFSAAGLLFPYHLGVAQFLIENGYIKILNYDFFSYQAMLLIQESTPLAGSSAGAIVCAVIASGASMDEALKATKILAEDCRSKGTAFRLGAVLRDILEKFLPEDVHIRSNGRVRVAVTQILWRPRGLLVDKFDSKEDLINAVRVCAFPANRLGLEGIGISPDCNPENRTTPREFFNWALEPAEDHILDRLFEFGYRDAAIWAKENPANELVQDGIPLVENGLAQ
ncbi:hypothetical protein G4B88_012536 [Cannabis sativa]|uniref:Patatin n=1 Tax=Cannabis sativa TaxID=3483 RepID=A0A7J6DLD1_CANSA|nr:hypothetical protein G4B88_012536 [Cannabis sativa]